MRSSGVGHYSTCCPRGVPQRGGSKAAWQTETFASRIDHKSCQYAARFEAKSSRGNLTPKKLIIINLAWSVLSVRPSVPAHLSSHSLALSLSLVVCLCCSLERGVDKMIFYSISSCRCPNSNDLSFSAAAGKTVGNQIDDERRTDRERQRKRERERRREAAHSEP